MIAFFKYLFYLVRHIHFVRMECFKRGLYLRGVLHDWSKWLPCEFFPYMNFFYNKKPRDKTGYYKPTDTGDAAFDRAWFHHQKFNDHHWQWWILPDDFGNIKVIEMSKDARLEMLCDWIGAGKAQGFSSPSDDPLKETRKWWEANKSKMTLYSETFLWFNTILEENVND